MKIGNLIYFTVALLSTALLWGCGSSGGGSSITTGSGQTVTNDPTPTVAQNPPVARTAWQTVPDITITGATVIDDALNPNDGQLTITFSAANQNGAPLSNLGSMSFIVAQLVPAGPTYNIAHPQDPQDPYFWQSYINRIENAAPGSLSGGPSGVNNNVGPDLGLPVYEKAIQATTETNGTLVNNNNGTYSYTFAKNLKTGTFFPEAPATMAYTFLGKAALAFDASATHRVAIQLSRITPDVMAPANVWYDFRPDGAALTATKDVAATMSCNSCHDGRLAIHGGNRTEVGYCVTCHNPGTVDANSGFNLDMAHMTHKIHRGANLPSVAAGGEYAIWGFRASKHDYTDLHYPTLYYQSTGEPLNCTTCHTDSLATPDGNNWYTKTSDLACFSCHDSYETGKIFAYNTVNNVIPGTATSYSRHAPAGTDPYPTDQTSIAPRNCGGCHTGDIPANFNYRRTFFAHDHDFARPQLQYIIESVTVNASNQPIVRFRIQERVNAGADFVDMNLLAVRPSYTPVYGGAPTPLTGAPNFALIYSTTGTDWDLARPLGQPATASIASLNGAFGVAGTGGTLEVNLDGSYTATITSATFPADSTRRAVFMQGYFSLGTKRLDTPSPLAFVAGDTERREVVDQSKCLGCHGGIGFHGGNRVDNPMVCAGCHNPRLSSSGHLITSTANSLGRTGEPGDEVTNNLKDMIHGIHSATLVGGRNQGTGLYYDFTGIHYPGVLSNCLACHKEGTFAQPAIGAVETTNIVVDRASAAVWLDDLVTSPYSASCVSCHNSTESISHLRAFGGVVRALRDDYSPGSETCAQCHSVGSPVKPINEVHSGLN